MDYLRIPDPGEETQHGNDMVRIYIGHAKVEKVFHFDQRHEAVALMVSQGLLDQAHANEYIRMMERVRARRPAPATNSVADALAKTIEFNNPPEQQLQKQGIGSFISR